MKAKLIIERHTEGPLKDEIENWWVEDERGNRWEIFSDNPPDLSVQYDTGKNCGTGRFVLEPGQDLAHGSEFPGVVHETPVGEFGVPCELEFPGVSKTENG
jgi:hypothetical protein